MGSLITEVWRLIIVEFIAATVDKGKALNKKNLEIAFNQFDMNGDG